MGLFSLLDGSILYEILVGEFTLVIIRTLHLNIPLIRRLIEAERKPIRVYICF